MTDITENEDTSGMGDSGRTFTQEDVNRINAKANKRIQELEKRLESSPSQDAIDELQHQLEALKQEKELAGKSQLERLQHEHARALEKMSNKYNQLEAELKARDEAVQAAKETLRKERLTRAFGAALAKGEVFPKSAGDALAVLMNEIADAEVNDDGSITASYGSDLVDETPEAIAAKFLEDRPWYVAAKGGGSGTPKPNGAPGRTGSIADKTADELFEEAGPMPSLHR